MLTHRRAVAEQFEIPWTAITPRMQRLLYAINAVAQPACMIAAGVFCGFTFISNAGAAVGPGACYEARQLIGLEILPEEAARAERNVRRIDPTGTARVLAADAVPFLAEFPDPIHLLYLDADGGPRIGKGIYLTILRACYARLADGAIVAAHNSVNGGARLKPYLSFVRDAANFRESVNVILDGEGLVDHGDLALRRLQLAVRIVIVHAVFAVVAASIFTCHERAPAPQLPVSCARPAY